jgi:hypothetical protein
VLFDPPLARQRIDEEHATAVSTEGLVPFHGGCWGRRPRLTDVASPVLSVIGEPTWRTTLLTSSVVSTSVTVPSRRAPRLARSTEEGGAVAEELGSDGRCVSTLSTKKILPSAHWPPHCLAMETCGRFASRAARPEAR